VRLCILALAIRQVNHIPSAQHFIFTCGLPASATFFHINSQKAQFLEQGYPK